MPTHEAVVNVSHFNAWFVIGHWLDIRLGPSANYMFQYEFSHEKCSLKINKITFPHSDCCSRSYLQCPNYYR